MRDNFDTEDEAITQLLEGAPVLRGARCDPRRGAAPEWGHPAAWIRPNARRGCHHCTGTPFDRMRIARTLAESFTLMSLDPRFASYGAGPLLG